MADAKQNRATGPQVNPARGGRADADLALIAKLERILRHAVSDGEIGNGEAEKILGQLGARRNGARSAGRKEEILKVATEIFSRKGYHATTLEEIGSELGMTRPAFYHYFQSKRDLLEEICAEAVDEADKVVRGAIDDRHPSITAKLQDVLISYAVLVTRAPSTAIVMRNFEEMSHAQQQNLARRRRTREAWVRALIAGGIESGEFTCPSPTIATLSIFEAIQGIQGWYDPEGKLSVEEVCAATIELFLRGLLVRDKG